MAIIWKYIVLFAGMAATPALSVSYIPQIIQLHKTKSAKDMNINFWLILNFALLMTTILALETYFTTGSISMLIAQGVNFALALVVLVQVIAYR